MTRLQLALVTVLAALAPVVAGCNPSLMVHRPADHAVDEAITSMWVEELERTAHDGDWLLSRSYSGQGDLVVIMTGGEEVSHAAMIDVTHGSVIESIASGVREIPLRDFVERNRHVIVIRPAHPPAGGRLALARARTRLGAGFDITGMVGVGSASRFYCSELVYWATGLHDQDPGRELVVTPGELLEYGELVYWSGQRDDGQVQRAAAGRAAARLPTRVAARARPERRPRNRKRIRLDYRPYSLRPGRRSTILRPCVASSPSLPPSRSPPLPARVIRPTSEKGPSSGPAPPRWRPSSASAR
jgi:hypothetical protein